MPTHEQITLPGSTRNIGLLRRIDRVYLLVASIFVAIAIRDPDQLLPLAALTLSNLAHTSVYMGIAVFLLSAVKATGAETMVASIFRGRENRMIILAAFVGGLAPFCSCEVIPFIAGLLALGTPLAPIMAFWLSSPLIDPPTLLITAGALGWKFALSKAAFAVGLGLAGGFLVKSIIAKSYLRNPVKAKATPNVSVCCSAGTQIPMACCPESGTMSDENVAWKFWKEPIRRQTFAHEFRTNGLFLLKWMFFAYTLESLMIQYIPAERIAAVVGGDGALPIILSALVGIPAYLNSYIAPPVVSGLISQGMSPGSGMAFIIAGAITSIPAMTAVYALVRSQVFAAYIILGFSGAVISGFLYQFWG